MAADLSSYTKQSAREQFGEASVEQLDRLVLPKYRADAGAAAQHMQPSATSVVELLPQGALFVLLGIMQRAAGLQASNAAEAEVEWLGGNARATVKALSAPGWTTAVASTVGERLLQLPEAEFKLLAAPGGHDLAALRFLGQVMSKNMSAAEVARALEEEAEGQRCVETFRTSATLGAVVFYASYNILDDLGDILKKVGNWLEGAAEWVKDAANTFGEWASKAANSVVESVFSKFENATKILEEIPGVGLVVAGIYSLAGDQDKANEALAKNVNAIVTMVAAAVGSAIGGPAGAVAGGMLGKTVGLLLQEWIATAIKDPTLKAEVGDISATRFVLEVALGGAAYGGASGVGKALAQEVGMGTVKKFATSTTLGVLLTKIPDHFVQGALKPL